MKKIFYYFFSSIFVSYIILLLCMFIFQRSLMYRPDINNHDLTPIVFQFEKVKIPSGDRIELNSWFSFKDSKKKTLVFFHGNAGNLRNRIYKLNEIDKMNVNFLLISWRGFSNNLGKPTEDGLYEDAASAIRWLEKRNIKKSDIILYGESLGTGVALELAKRDIYAGIILESPYTSMVDMAEILYPYLPVSILLKDRYVSIEKIKENKSPILVMHGKMDMLVPFFMGKKIYEEANNPKYSYFPSGSGHMMRYDPYLVDALQKFINSL